MAIMRLMTDDDSDNVPVTVRLHRSVIAWLEEKRRTIKTMQGVDVTLQAVLKGQLDRAKRLDDDPSTTGPRGPKKARQAT
jgi:hypothetical protein